MSKEQKRPSIYDSLFWVVQDKKLDSEVFFYFRELFWPEFLQKDGFFFLKESFSEEKYKDLVGSRPDVEFWMNLLTVDPYFDDDPHRDERAATLSQTLVQTWDAKLKRDFPDTDFVVKYLHDEEVGDYGLTFYQK